MSPDQSVGYAFYGVEPFYPGLAVAFLIWVVGRDGDVEDSPLR